MAKKSLWLGLAVVSVIVLNGCAMMNKDAALTNQGLRNKVSALETQLKEKDDEINSLRDAQVQSLVDLNANVNQGNQLADPKQIQIALKNAGYFPGTIDGKMGKKTRRAIREFQKANNLQVDGRVGKSTWTALKEYLDKKVK